MNAHTIIRKALVLSALALVLAAPAAADPWGRDDYLRQQRSNPTSVRPDDRSGMHGVGSPLPAVQVAASGSTSFEWGDAAIGGATAIGLVLLSSGLVLIAYRRRTRFAH